MAQEPQEGIQERPSTPRRYAGSFRHVSTLCVPLLPLLAVLATIMVLAWAAFWPLDQPEQGPTDSFTLADGATPVTELAPAATSSAPILDTVNTIAPWDFSQWPCENILRDWHCRPHVLYPHAKGESD